MKVICKYESYDGIRFDTREECENYEQYALDMIRLFCEAVTFTDDDDEVIEDMPEENVPLDVWMGYFEHAYNVARFVKIDHLVEDAWVWVTNTYGYNLPEDDGLYEYDGHCNWVRLP